MDRKSSTIIRGLIAGYNKTASDKIAEDGWEKAMPYVSGGMMGVGGTLLLQQLFKALKSRKKEEVQPEVIQQPEIMMSGISPDLQNYLMQYY
jgi:hypothetical protein